MIIGNLARTTVEGPTLLINTNGHYTVEEAVQLLKKSKNIISKEDAYCRLIEDYSIMSYAYIVETKDTYSLTTAKLYRTVQVSTLLVVTSEEDIPAELYGIAAQHNIFKREENLWNT